MSVVQVICMPLFRFVKCLRIHYSKVMRCTRNEDGARLNVMLNGEALEEVDQFKYLGSVIAANGGVEADVCNRVKQKSKAVERP